jgi:hypothetical protein
MPVKLVESQGPKVPPSLMCPHCNKENLMSLNPFEKNISGVVEDKCVHCGGKIYAALLLLGNKDLVALYRTIQQIVELIQNKNQSPHIIKP